MVDGSRGRARSERRTVYCLCALAQRVGYGLLQGHRSALFPRGLEGLIAQQDAQGGMLAIVAGTLVLRQRRSQRIVKGLRSAIQPRGAVCIPFRRGEQGESAEQLCHAL